jgi:hypothetical protein
MGTIAQPPAIRISSTSRPHRRKDLMSAHDSSVDCRYCGVLGIGARRWRACMQRAGMRVVYSRQ